MRKLVVELDDDIERVDGRELVHVDAHAEHLGELVHERLHSDGGAESAGCVR
ncbi:MAG: hypothetical protein ACLPZR_18645 [Solirubrobacteraceae bacterium]